MKKFIPYWLLTMISSWNYAQEVVDVTLSECDRIIPPQLVNQRIISRTIKQDTLFLSLGFSANCCIEPKPTIVYRNDTLFLKRNYYSDYWCGCDCCFNLNLKITAIKDTGFILVMDQMIVKPSTSKLIKLPDDYQFNEKTVINQSDIHNYKIGLWRYYHKNSNQISREEYYSKEWKKPARVWFKDYDKQGNLVSVGIRTNPYGSLFMIEPENYHELLNNR